MTKTMLIDAANQEEVRVCVLENGKVEDFDFEYSSRKPLRGNIYLARVTRVEPSLQAAFVEYGGNRHGFLAFSEIHPDYYQVPVSDRRAIQEAEAEEAALAAALNLTQRDDDDDDDGGIDEIGDDAGEQDDAIQNLGGDDDDLPEAKTVGADTDTEDDNGAAEDANDDAPGDVDDAGEDPDEEEEEEEPNETDGVDNEDDDDGEDGDEEDEALNAKAPADANEEDDDSADADDDVEEDTAEDASNAPLSELSRAQLLDRYKEARRKKARLLRNYKIQEVIKRRQILLVQVVK
ncbi:MAG: S1 RNA-binding domain-containing protein, partial [Parvularculaceae bacterium]|nr:S1 RNA-binding domain-containing protein [Parvularculaceae bacterium]